MSHTQLQNMSRPSGDKMTYIDRHAQTRWGKYLIGVEGRVIDRYRSIAEAPAEAVDIGCGTGQWARQLFDLGWKVTCIDVDEQALEICRSRVPGAKCILASLSSRTIPVDSNVASLAVCIEVAPVIEADWFLPELQRVCRPGAVFVGVHVNRRSWRGLAVRLKYFLTRSYFGNIYYLTAYREWKKRLAAAGFELIHEEGFCWAPFERDSNSVFVPLFTRLERLLRLHQRVDFSPWVVFAARKRNSVDR
jgi:SAM-dependent methyltransferase